MWCFHRTLPPSPQGPVTQKRKRENLSAKGGKRLQGKSLLGWQTSELTLKLWVCIRTAQIQAKQNPSCKGGSWHKVLSLTKRLFAVDSCWGRKNQFSSEEGLWIHQPYSELVEKKNIKGLHKVFCILLLLLLWFGIGFCFLLIHLSVLPFSFSFWKCFWEITWSWMA